MSVSEGKVNLLPNVPVSVSERKVNRHPNLYVSVSEGKVNPQLFFLCLLVKEANLHPDLSVPWQ